MQRNQLSYGIAALALMAATDSTTAPAATTPAPAKPKTVNEDMDSRRMFNTTDEAKAYLVACGTNLSDFGDMAFAAVGIDENGEFDPEIYVEGMRVMVATLREAKKGVRAIVVAPAPSLEMVLADDAARDWLVTKVLDKEINHVAVRVLRTASDISTVVDQMPSTLAAYISSARGDGEGIMATYDELHKQLNTVMSGKVQVWAKARLVKSDLKKAFESKGFANEYYPSLENRGEGKPSLFVMALQLGISFAKAKGLDPTIFERWLETRDSKVFTPGVVAEDDEDFDVESLTTAMLAEPAATATADAEAPAQADETAAETETAET